jgi:hypothetical protein
MLLNNKSNRSLFLSNQMDVLYGCLTILDLLGPIVFKGRPLFTDGHGFQKASAHLFDHFASQEFWPRAKEMAQYGVDAGRTMAAQDLKEPQYIRWEAEALERLGAAETKLENAKAATDAFARSVQLYRDLYAALPNGPRMADVIGALERAVKRSPGKSRATQSSAVKAELSALQKLRQKIESFAGIAGLRPGDVPADLLGQLAGALKVSHGSGTRTDADYSGPYTSTYLTPRANLDPAAWETFDRLLRTAGYEWTKTYVGGKKGWDTKWEKWIPAS